MSDPFLINFDDGVEGVDDGIWHLGSIEQSAPYSRRFKIKRTSDGQYISFLDIDEIRMQARATLGGNALFTLTKTAGHFLCEADSLTIKFPGSITTPLAAPSATRPGLQQLSFVYDIFFFKSGLPTWKFAKGEGVIDISATKPTGNK